MIALAALLPAAAAARSIGPPGNRTGAAVDGGQSCTACHRSFAANSGLGRVSIGAATYTPGARQNITVTVEDPIGQRWGFELTARLRSDETRAAGTFTAVPDRIRVICGDNDAPAPCNGAKEFATHVAASTQQGTRERATFTIEWTAPAEDVGEVIFYVAANAADGSGNNVGERVYTGSAVIRPACNISARPTSPPRRMRPADARSAPEP